MTGEETPDEHCPNSHRRRPWSGRPCSGPARGSGVRPSTGAATHTHGSHQWWLNHGALPDDRGQAPRRALDAAKAWLDCPCEKHQWKARPEAQATELGNLPWAFGSIREIIWPGQATCEWGIYWHAGITEAARYLGEKPVRKAITAELIRWAVDA